MYGPPCAHGGHAEAGVGLRLIDVLGSAHGDEGRLGQAGGYEWHRVRDRKRVTVEEHQQIFVGGLV